MTERVLPMITIYQSPLDYPGKFVVREFFVFNVGMDDPVPAEEPMAVVDTLEEARAVIPEGMWSLGRAPADHESVVETWI